MTIKTLGFSVLGGVLLQLTAGAAHAFSPFQNLSNLLNFKERKACRSATDQSSPPHIKNGETYEFSCYINQTDDREAVRAADPEVCRALDTWNDKKFHAHFNKLKKNDIQFIQCCSETGGDDYNDGNSCEDLTYVWSMNNQSSVVEQINDFKTFASALKPENAVVLFDDVSRAKTMADLLQLGNALLDMNVSAERFNSSFFDFQAQGAMDFAVRMCKAGAYTSEFTQYLSIHNPAQWIQVMNIFLSQTNDPNMIPNAVQRAWQGDDQGMADPQIIQWLLSHGATASQFVSQILSYGSLAQLAAVNQIVNYTFTGSDVAQLAQRGNVELLEYVVAHATTNQGPTEPCNGQSVPVSVLRNLLAANVPQDVIQQLIAREPDLSVVDTCQANPTFLSMAAAVGNLTTVNLLIQSKAPVDETFSTPGTDGKVSIHDALYVAIVDRQSDNALALIQNMKTLNRSYENGATPLSLAIDNGLTAVVKVLAASGQFNLNTQDSNGDTALMRLLNSWGNSAAMVSALLAAPGVDVNLQDSNGKTALMFAASNPQETQSLLSAGACVLLVDKTGHTAELYAYENNPDVYALIQAAIKQPGHC